MAYSNFHTHSTYCDGVSSLEETVLTAIEMGCKSLGFSGHSYTFFDEEYAMTQEGTEAYKHEVGELKDKYADQIRILCGIEQDFFSDEPTEGYDFVIGSVHYVLKDGVYVPVDNTAEDFVADVAKHFDGDYLAFCEAYYAQVADVVEKTGCTFVGHFDLVTKFNQDNKLFDMGHPRYVKASSEALEALCAQGAMFEINTGAMAKGYRTEPYPSVRLLRQLAAAHAPVILTSDCHKASMLQFGLKEADDLAKSLGLQVVYEL